MDPAQRVDEEGLHSLRGMGPEEETFPGVPTMVQWDRWHLCSPGMQVHLITSLAQWVKNLGVATAVG